MGGATTHLSVFAVKVLIEPSDDGPVNKQGAHHNDGLQHLPQGHLPEDRQVLSARTSPEESPADRREASYQQHRRRAVGPEQFNGEIRKHPVDPRNDVVHVAGSRGAGSTVITTRTGTVLQFFQVTLLFIVYKVI